MKKVLVLSDSHGMMSGMELAVETEKPDLIIHLGDCTEDAEELSRTLGLTPLISVRGNCDTLSSKPLSFCGKIENVRVFACHGHRYQVKNGLLPLSYAAMEEGASVCLFGHTHEAFASREGELLMLNPGSCGYYRATYALLRIDGSTVDYEIKRIEGR